MRRVLKNVLDWFLNGDTLYLIGLMLVLIALVVTLGFLVSIGQSNDTKERQLCETHGHVVQLHPTTHGWFCQEDP